MVKPNWLPNQCLQKLCCLHREQELLTRQAKERAEDTQKELEEAKAKITELEAELQTAKAAAEQQGRNSGKTSRSSSRGMGQKRGTKLSLGQTPTRLNNKRS